MIKFVSIVPTIVQIAKAVPGIVITLAELLKSQTKLFFVQVPSGVLIFN